MEMIIQTFTDLNHSTLNVTHLTSSFVTASTIETNGSHIFGDSITDTQEPEGITASGNISSSGKNLYVINIIPKVT